MELGKKRIVAHELYPYAEVENVGVHFHELTGKGHSEFLWNGKDKCHIDSAAWANILYGHK
jgi:hypothetical protein